jgi:hypothetical protein
MWVGNNQWLDSIPQGPITSCILGGPSSRHGNKNDSDNDDNIPSRRFGHGNGRWRLRPVRKIPTSEEAVNDSGHVLLMENLAFSLGRPCPILYLETQLSHSRSLESNQWWILWSQWVWRLYQTRAWCHTQRAPTTRRETSTVVSITLGISYSDANLTS